MSIRKKFFYVSLNVALVLSSLAARPLQSIQSASKLSDARPVQDIQMSSGQEDLLAAAIYPNPTAAILWSGQMRGVSDVQAAFNHARTVENNQLGTSLPMMTLPSQTEWNSLSDGQKALWLINRERSDRGITPLDSLESNVTSVAQKYAQYLFDHNAFDHNADGHTPEERLNTIPAINACHDFLGTNESLANFATTGSSIPLPIERAVYEWMYDDADSLWGHRLTVLWNSYTDNSGPAGQEGFLGIGRAHGGPWQGDYDKPYPYVEIIVMNVFDPCSTWSYPYPPGAATLVSPSGEITTKTPAYTWNLSPDTDTEDPATSYYLSVAEVNGDNSTSVHAQWYDAAEVCSDTKCSVTPDGVILSGGNYRWRIKTRNDVGEGPWSDPMDFNLPTLSVPGAATLLSPSGSITETTPIYTWNRVNTATRYSLSVGKVNGDGSLTTIHAASYDAAQVCSGATCSVTPAGVTLSAGDYRWRIRTSNDVGDGPWSDQMDFNIPAPPVPFGIYDDTDSNWVYSGSWSTYSGVGPYNNTMHYTATAGSYAELLFHGARFTLTFTKASTWGSLDVYVDGGKIDTINAQNGTTLWQQSYTSPIFTEGDHTVRLVHAGGGTYIDIDAIQIFGPPVYVPTGLYDDANTNWTYSGAWTAYTGSGPASNTLHYTGTAGSYAELLFHGTKFILTFTKSSAWGSLDVYVDGNKIDTINAYSPMTVWQQSYASPAFAEGDHTVRLVHAGGGTYIDIDAIRICGVAGVVPVGTYDDNDCNWTYSGAWTAYTGSGPASNTMHYTATAGNYAELRFHGARFTLTFTKASTWGSLDVYVDGNKIDTIHATNSTVLWQQTYTSPVFAEGDHTVRLVHAGGGTYIDIDAIQIFGPPVYVAAGNYDDADTNWIYSGAWTAYTGSGPANNTMHYSGTVGSSAELFFHGARFSLTFTRSSAYGSIDVYVDGSKIDTINAQNGTTLWQQTYTSSVFAEGDHTVRLVHAGGGTYIDIDAIQIFGPPVYVAAGNYDDADTNWIYSGAWTAYTGSGPAGNTMHYTGTAGSSAELYFHGTKFILTFTKSSAYGSIDVYVDGSKVDTIDAQNGTTLWQQTYTSPVFAEGDHTVRLVHAGGGAYIDIDSIQIE